MSEVLVLVDHVDGKVTKPTTELLTIARRLGEPSAVLIGGDAATAAETLTKFGAEKIYVVDDADIKDYLVAPKAEVLAQLVEKTAPTPAAVLIPLRRRGQGDRRPPRGQDRLRADHRRGRRAGEGPVTTQSVFAGNFTVQAKVTKGVPIITVKPNSTTPEAVDGAGAAGGRSPRPSPTPRRPPGSPRPSPARPPGVPS